MSIFTDMSTILKPIEVGNAKIETYRIPELYRRMYGTPDKEYTRLFADGQMMMSDTDMERRTSTAFVLNASGDVLICGLGLGMVLIPLFANPKVTSITVIEKYQDVIDCVWPQIELLDTTGKCNVVCADCFKYTPTRKYNTIFLDIWPYINSDIYKEEMKPLKSRYRKYLDNTSTQYKPSIYVWAELNARYDRPLY